MKSKEYLIVRKKLAPFFKKSFIPELLVMVFITLVIAGLLFLIAL